MGVKLHKWIVSEKIPIDILSGKTIAIDGMNMLFQILYNPAQRSQQLTETFYFDSTQRVITHLYGWLQKVNNFYRKRILPIVIFDGKPDPLKRKTSKNWAHDFLEVEEMYKECLKNGNLQAARNHAMSKSYMFMNCIHESKELLEACGIPVIMAPSEAEAQCVSLEKAGLVDYIVSNDYDLLLFGGKHIIRKLTFQNRHLVDGKWKTKQAHIDYIDTEKNLARLKINREQLIDLSILLGNDYFPGISKIGPLKAIDSIYYYSKLENMIIKHPELFNELTFSKVEEIRNLFLSHETININKITLHSFNEQKLRHLLLYTHTLNEEKINRALSNIKWGHRKMIKYFGLNPQKIFFESRVPFNIHIQRRLARARQVNNNEIHDLSFTAAINLSQKKSYNKKKETIENESQSEKYAPKLLKLKDFYTTKET